MLFKPRPNITPTAKFKSANIFVWAAQDQTAKFKDRQYFRLYGIALTTVQ